MQNLNRNVPYQSNDKGESVVATVNFCERCESMGKSIVMGTLGYRTDPTKGVKELELCPGCVEDFMTWLKEDIMTTREKAYKEPWKDGVSGKGEVLTKQNLQKLLRALESGDDAKE